MIRPADLLKGKKWSTMMLTSFFLTLKIFIPLKSFNIPFQISLRNDFECLKKLSDFSKFSK